MHPFHVAVSACPLLTDPPFVIVLTWLAAAFGRRVLRWLGASSGNATALEHGVVCAAAGFALLQAVPLALGLFHLLYPSALWAAFGVAALLLARDMWAVARAVVRRRPGAPGGWLLAATMLLAVPLLLAALMALCPPTDADGLGYHLNAPKRWLQAGAIGYLPTHLQTNLPMGLEMYYLVAMALWSDTAAKLVHTAMAVLMVAGTFALGRRTAGDRGGVLAAACLFLGPLGGMVVALAGSAYVEMGVAMEALAAALAFAIGRSGGGRGWILAAALCAGGAGAFKVTGLGVGLALLALVVFGGDGADGAAAAPRLRRAGLFLLVMLLPVAPWFVRGWIDVGTPVFPLFSSVLHVRDWTPEATTRFNTFYRYLNWAPNRPLSLEQRHLLRGAALGLLALLAALAWRGRRREVGLLGWVAALSAFCVAWNGGLYMRFFLPLVPLALAALPCAFRPGLRRRGAPAMLLAFLGVEALFLVGSQRHALAAMAAAAVGRTPRDAFLRGALPIYSAWEFTNARVPSTATMLVVASGSTYYLEPFCLTTEVPCQTRIPQDSWPAYEAAVRRNGVAYLLVAEAGFNDRNPPRVAAFLENEFPLARRLAETHGELLYRDSEARLYALHWDRPPAPAAGK